MPALFERHAIDDVDFCAEEGDILEIAYKSGMLVFMISIRNQFGQTNDNDIFFILIRPLFTMSLLAFTVDSDDVYCVFQERTTESEATNVNS